MLKLAFSRLKATNIFKTKVVRSAFFDALRLSVNIPSLNDKFKRRQISTCRLNYFKAFLTNVEKLLEFYL